LPLITTWVPTGPLEGANPVMAGVTLKVVALVADPPGVVTLILPVPPAGASAVIWPSLSTVKWVELMPPNLTLVAPVNPLPLITTWVPTGPLEGANPVMAGPGGAVTVSVAVSVKDPSVPVTVWVPAVVEPHRAGVRG